MEEQKSALLDEGEEILWTGKPDNLVLFDLQNKKAIIMRWIICLTIFICATFGYVLYCKSVGQDVRPLFILILVGVLGYIMVDPIVCFFNLKKVTYQITNQRAMVICKNKVLELKRSEIDGLALVHDTEGMDSLKIGSVLKNVKEKKFRTITLFGRDVEVEEGIHKKGILFYHAKGLNEAYQILVQETEA